MKTIGLTLLAAGLLCFTASPQAHANSLVARLGDLPLIPALAILLL